MRDLDVQPFEINYKSNRVFMPYDQKYKIGDGFNVYFEFVNELI